MNRRDIDYLTGDCFPGYHVAEQNASNSLSGWQEDEIHHSNTMRQEYKVVKRDGCSSKPYSRRNGRVKIAVCVSFICPENLILIIRSALGAGLKSKSAAVMLEMALPAFDVSKREIEIVNSCG
jgi:hypothetical protein